MERYTYFDGGKWRLKIGDTEYSGDWVERLAAYEETGLEPEEIRDSIGGISPICVQCDGKTSDGVVTEKCGYPDDITKCLEQSKHLCELAQAEKEGRLVVLPCEIGSPVYSHARKLDGADYVRETEFWWSDIPQMGKTVFLTREAAEAALKEKEAEHESNV
jgi:hypothetical protein